MSCFYFAAILSRCVVSSRRVPSLRFANLNLEMHLRLPPSNHADLMQESSSIMSALNTAKSALRRAMKQRLKQVDSATTMSECTQSTLSPLTRANGYATAALVVARIFKAPYWRDSKKVSIYLSTPNGEVQTDKLVRDAFTTGPPSSL